ncbi:MAG: glycosyltransferase family 4 protein [Vicingaceae bacterium]
MNILVLTTSFPLKDGIAVGIHVLEKCRGLVKSGNRVRVIAPHHPGALAREIIDGIEIIRFKYFFPTSLQKLAYGSGIPTNLRRNFLAKVQLPFFLMSFFYSAITNGRGFKIIHSHWSIAGFVGVISAFFLNAKTVLSMHGAEVFVLGKNMFLGFTLKQTDLIVCNSNFTKDQIESHYEVGAINVIHPGADTNRFQPTANENLRERLNLSEEDFFVLTIGKFIPRKGLEFLIRAIYLVAVREGHARVKLRIGGRGYLKSAYLELIKDLRIESHIEFLDYIPDEHIPEYYSEADVFVLPSIIDDRGDTEGLGVVLIEAGACQTPVIASRVGGIVDVVEHGINGYLVEEKNSEKLVEKIIELHKDSELRKVMGQNGRKIALAKFSWENNSKEFIKAYSQLLSSL